MAITTRQTSLLVQQDWTKIYQTFREADFQSFDFETLRKSMIEYLRAYYPEDFNDFTESSEYVALIDLIAFLGQSLAFRTDINARENFIDTAERRDSILKLARLLSYNPKRNIPASGLLKIDSVSTTETIFDSVGTNLTNLAVSWNDTTNENWLEQFTAIINASLTSTQVVGKPGASQIVNGIKTDEYSVDVLNNLLPTYGFVASVAGVSYPFEVVSASTQGQSYIYETEPAPNGKFNVLYQNDNRGNESNSTGYFLYFKQGELRSLDFTISETLPNRVVSINFDNINNTDVWLYSLDANNNPSEKWTLVPAINGTNVIYNTSAERNLYSVSTRANDQIDLVFGDGAFTNIPVGRFRLYYRVSNNLTYKITPDEIVSIPVTIPYVGRSGRAETLTIRASLQYTVTNASSRETLESIRTKAPQQYYTQNRMITGEDYNTLPFTSFNNVVKAKAVNRTSSGISRFLDVVDASGKYSSTNIFAQDGILYREDQLDFNTFQFSSSVEVNSIIRDVINPMVAKVSSRHLYYDTATRVAIEGIEESVSNMVSGSSYIIVSGGSTDFTLYGASDSQSGTVFTSTGTGTGTGTVKRLVNWALRDVSAGRAIGTFSGPSYSYLNQGALVKFASPTGYYFDAQNRLQAGIPSTEYHKTTLWASVIDYPTPGSSDAILSVTVPTGAVVSQVIPSCSTNWSSELVDSIKNNILSYKTFGIRYDLDFLRWEIIDEVNLSNEDFSLLYAGDTSSTGKDSSWFIKLSYENQAYTVTSRGIDYYFQSVKETRFYFDPDIKVYDSKTASVKRDTIKVLRTNTKPDSSDALYYSKSFRVWDNVIEVDGYEDNRKILVTFPDDNLDSVPDDPDLFTDLIAPKVNIRDKFVFSKRVVDQYQFSRFDPIPHSSVVTDYPTARLISEGIQLYPVGSVFYAYTEDKFYISNSTGITETTDYIARVGREELMFQYTHTAPYNRRIDPSPNNIIDLYILTKSYSDDYFAYINDTSNRIKEPVPPTNEELRTNFGSIENLKAISDSLIYNSATFKPLFGQKADPALRATFKVVKNPLVNISDNDVKSQVVSAINDYFEINNWDFGESFYFSELSAYLHNVLAPNVSSIIIVPTSDTETFGTLYQINAEANEIITSAATVDNVQIISAITAGQINQQIG